MCDFSCEANYFLMVFDLNAVEAVWLINYAKRLGTKLAAVLF